MLEIKNLKASINKKQILNNLNLDIKNGEFMPLWVLTDQVKAH